MTTARLLVALGLLVVATAYELTDTGVQVRVLYNDDAECKTGSNPVQVILAPVGNCTTDSTVCSNGTKVFCKELPEAIAKKTWPKLLNMYAVQYDNTRTTNVTCEKDNLLAQIFSKSGSEIDNAPKGFYNPYPASLLVAFDRPSADKISVAYSDRGEITVGEADTCKRTEVEMGYQMGFTMTKINTTVGDAVVRASSLFPVSVSSAASSTALLLATLVAAVFAL